MITKEIKVNIEDSPIATLTTGDEGEILFFNKAAEKLLGKISGNSTFSEFVDKKPIPENLINSTAIRLTLDPDAELRLLKSREGKLFYASVFCSADRDNCKTIYFRDIDKQIRYIVSVKHQLEIELRLLRSTAIRNGDLEMALREISLAASETMKVGRINIWEIDENFSSIRSILNFDKSKGGFIENITLYRNQFPRYFELMQTEEIIITNDALNNPQTSEIKNNYLIPNGILSLLDCPIRIGGKMVGVVCFEETGQMREWNVSEQNFAFSITQIIALTLETSRRQKMQSDLEQALNEKKVLLTEINHRVKNNFGLISEIVQIQEQKSKDDYHRKLFSEIESRIISMAMIHRQLYMTDNFGIVNFRDYLLDFTSHFRATCGNDKVEIATLLDNCHLPISKAVLCGLVINEIFNHCCRNKNEENAAHIVMLKMSVINETVEISVSDSSGKLDSEKKIDDLKLINELVERLKGNMKFATASPSAIQLQFSAL